MGKLTTAPCYPGLRLVADVLDELTGPQRCDDDIAMILLFPEGWSTQNFLIRLI